jgi:hypothetical protein
MAGARQQFGVLYRAFLARVVDLDSLPDPGAVRKLAVQFMAMLAGFSFVVAVYEIPRYSFSALPPGRLLVAAWGDEEFLIATAMALAGLLAVLGWNAVLPGRQDALVLGPLPVRAGSIALAKSAAVASVAALGVLALNCFTGVSFPFVLIPPGGNVARTFCAYWLTMAGAAAFIFCALVALECLTALALGYRLFLRASGFLQLLAFFAILSVYFLKPPLANVQGLTSPANQRALHSLPSYWFLGLFQELNGSAHAVFGPLAERALAGLAIASLAAAATYALACRRIMRRLVEQAEIVPADRWRPLARLVRYAVSLVAPRPVERAVILFVARTLARSRQHRLLLGAYLGIGMAIALAYMRSYLYGYAERPWHEANVPFLGASIVLLFFVVIGARATFALPAPLGANWVFRLTAVHRPALYFAAVRKSLFALAAGVCLACSLADFALWPARPAAEHAAVLAALAVLFVERALGKFRKLPFACSYLPGKANLHVSLYAYGVLFLFLTDSGSRVELWSLARPARYLPLLAVLVAGALWARRRTLEYAESEYNRVQFEDLPPAEVFALDLRRDGALLGDDAYVDAIGSHRTRQRPGPG